MSSQDYIPIALYICKRRFRLLYILEKQDVLAECEYIKLLAQAQNLEANSEEFLKLAYQDLKALAHAFDLKRDSKGWKNRFLELIEEVHGGEMYCDLIELIETATKLLKKLEKENNKKKNRHAINRLNLLISEFKELSK